MWLHLFTSLTALLLEVKTMCVQFMLHITECQSHVHLPCYFKTCIFLDVNITQLIQVVTISEFDKVLTITYIQILHCKSLHSRPILVHISNKNRSTL